jgi:integrase/recombinase XerD
MTAPDDSPNAGTHDREALVRREAPVTTIALAEVVALWADATTDPSSARRRDLLRDKTRVVVAFFEWTGKGAAEVSPLDVKAWQGELERRSQKPASVYYALSRLSSFYTWALANTPLRDLMRESPVAAARPKAPRKYGGESTKALSDEEARALVAVVRARAASGDAVGKRDLAILLFHLTTGLRRAEVSNLRRDDVTVEADRLVVRTRVKGGDYVGVEVAHPDVRAALDDYLAARGHVTGADALWARHDRGAFRSDGLTSRAFANNLKRYAAEAGIAGIHVHRLRHTFGRLVADGSGSLLEVQEALGHKDLATTRVYVSRITTRKDRFSGHVGRVLGPGLPTTS